MAKIVIFVTEDWHFCTHRLSLAVAAKKAGHEIVVVTRVQLHGEAIRSQGLALEPVRLSRSGNNPLSELAVIYWLVKTYRRLRPDLVHHVALKPVLYGSIAALIAGVPRVVNAIAGLGYIFTSSQVRAKLLRPWVQTAWRILLSRGVSRVIVQNPDDQRLLLDRNIVSAHRLVLIRGAGVNIDVFSPTKEPAGTPVIVLPARLLWDKGVGEFVAAAGEIRRSGIAARFALVGQPDSENPSAVPIEQIRLWERDGLVEWWGQRADMPIVYAQSHIVCLPSYREGLPKSLLEAAACSRAIVTTDAPGCREIVRDGENGFLVPIRDGQALAEAIMRLIMDSDLRQRMGRRGREIVVTEFGIETVIDQTLSLYQDLLQ